jgi:hypothetical protein
MLMASRHFGDKRNNKKGTLISVIFLNINWFEKYNGQYLRYYFNLYGFSFDSDSYLDFSDMTDKKFSSE